MIRASMGINENRPIRKRIRLWINRLTVVHKFVTIIAFCLAFSCLICYNRDGNTICLTIFDMISCMVEAAPAKETEV